MLLAAALLAVPVPAVAQSGPALSDVRAEIANRTSTELREFYRSRDHRPLWISSNGLLDPAARSLLDLVETSELDGLDPRALRASILAKALRQAAQKPSAAHLGRAEVILSQTFAEYAKALRRQRSTSMIYVSPELAPVEPTTKAVLQGAAAASSLQRYVADLGWMHPLYGQLRRAVATGTFDPARSEALSRNLGRLRAIPAQPAARYVLVDAAGARLWMYEDGQVVDSMKVVVGKADNQTPMIAGYLRNAILNPYWNVPVDLAQTRIAANVLAKGVGYLAAGGYQVLSDWSADAKPVDPATIDWQAVAQGSQELRVRQLPGRANFMGKVKFEFPNELGIYLHDTPEKNLMREDQRQHSSGCVRLEDAQRFGRWLLRQPLPRRVTQVEQRVDLPEVVPVYITYLTAMPQKGGIAYNPDPYGRDGMILAGGGSLTSRSR
jgi:murein L,D-transpeptidase YcbB/YkuD